MFVKYLISACYDLQIDNFSLEMGNLHLKNNLITLNLLRFCEAILPINESVNFNYLLYV